MPGIIHRASTAISRTILQVTMEEHLDFFVLMAKGFYRLGYASSEPVAKKQLIDMAQGILQDILPEKQFKENIDLLSGATGEHLERIFHNISESVQLYREHGTLKDSPLFRSSDYPDTLKKEQVFLQTRFKAEEDFRNQKITKETYERLKITEEEYLKGTADLVARVAYQRLIDVRRKMDKQFSKVFESFSSNREILQDLDPRIISFFSSIQSALTELKFIDLEQIPISIAQAIDNSKKSDPKSITHQLSERWFINRIRAQYQKIMVDKVAVEKEHLAAIIDSFKDVDVAISPATVQSRAALLVSGETKRIDETRVLARDETKVLMEEPLLEGVSMGHQEKLENIFGLLNYNFKTARDISHYRLGTKSHEVYKWTSFVVALQSLRNLSSTDENRKMIAAFIAANRETIEQTLAKITVVEKKENDKILSSGKPIVRNLTVDDLNTKIFRDEDFAQLLTNVLPDKVRDLDGVLPIGYRGILSAIKDNKLPALLTKTLNSTLQIDLEPAVACTEPVMFTPAFLNALSRRKKTMTERMKSSSAEAVLRSGSGLSAISDAIADMTGVLVKNTDLKILLDGSDQAASIHAMSHILQDMFGVKISEKILAEFGERPWGYLSKVIQEEAGIRLDIEQLEAVWNNRNRPEIFQKKLLEFFNRSNLLGQVLDSPRFVSFGKKWLTNALQIVGLPSLVDVAKLPDDISLKEYLWRELKIYDPNLRQEEIAGFIRNPTELIAKLLTIQTQWSGVSFTKEEIEKIMRSDNILNSLQTMIQEKVVNKAGELFSTVFSTPFSSAQTRMQLEELMLFARQVKGGMGTEPVVFETKPVWIKRFLSSQSVLKEHPLFVQKHLIDVLLSYDPTALKRLLENNSGIRDKFPVLQEELAGLTLQSDPNLVKQFLEKNPEFFDALLEIDPQLNQYIAENEKNVVPCSTWGQVSAHFAPWLTEQSLSHRVVYEAEETFNSVLLAGCSRIHDFIAHQEALGSKNSILINYKNKIADYLKRLAEIEVMQEELVKKYQTALHSQDDSKILLFKTEGEMLIKQKFELMEEIHQEMMNLAKKTKSQEDCYLLATLNLFMNEMRDLKVFLSATKGMIQSMPLESHVRSLGVNSPVHNNMIGQFTQFLMHQKTRSSILLLDAFCQSSMQQGRTLQHSQAPIQLTAQQVGWLQECFAKLAEFFQWMFGLNDTPTAVAKSDIQGKIPTKSLQIRPLVRFFAPVEESQLVVKSSVSASPPPKP